jgi:putative PIN family toxin of toxin-antitoxin system
MTTDLTLRVVIDTNVLLSGIAFPASIPGKIMYAWRCGSIAVVLSEFILGELRRVLPRLSHRHHLTDIEIDDLVDILALQADLVEPCNIHEPDLRDALDMPVLGTLLAAQQSGGLDYLITGDGDLLALANRYPIVTPAEFWSRHGGL